MIRIVLRVSAVCEFLPGGFPLMFERDQARPGRGIVSDVECFLEVLLRQDKMKHVAGDGLPDVAQIADSLLGRWAPTSSAM